MKVVVDVNHPAHVHYFKNFIWRMKDNGHDILITASKKEVSFALLQNYGFKFIDLGTYGRFLGQKAINIPLMDLKEYRAVKGFNPDIFLGFGSIRNAHVSRVIGKPCIALDDTEHAKLEHLLYVPFTDVVLTPTWYRKDFGEKQVRYHGYTELAYLHPSYFTPDPSVLKEQGLSDKDMFVVLRFVSWNASHDLGQGGIQDKVGLVRKLEKHAKVIISSEGTLPSDLEKYRLKVHPGKLHSLLYYASLYIGEGATTASESAILGTHAIYVNTLRVGNIQEQEEKYHLAYAFHDKNRMQVDAFEKALKLLQDKNLKREGKKKKEKLLEDTIDLTAFMIWFVENYPQSMKDATRNPCIQEHFKTGLVMAEMP